MSALIYLVDTLLGLCLLVFLLRLLLQWVRADFRNPVGKALLQITNPVILPLRRLIPAFGRLDSASAVAIMLIVLLRVAVPFLLSGFGLPPALIWLRIGVLQLVNLVLWTYFWAIFIYALGSMIAPGSYSPITSMLTSLCEPILRRFRAIIPPLGGLDFSPLWAGILIQTLLRLLG
jgi:YggT family protein